MAARKKRAKALKGKAGEPPRPTRAVTWAKREVEVEARSVMTVEYDGGELPAFVLEEAAGAIVRVRPVVPVDGDELDRLRDQLNAAGAVAVKLLPPPVAKVAVAGRTEAKPDLPLRQRVLRRIEESKNLRDPAALAALLGVVMDEEGL